MKNVIFISPNFPENYWLFCRELMADGVNVLGIGDQAYSELFAEDVYDDINIETCVEKRISKGGTSTESVLEQIAWVKERIRTQFEE